MNGSLKSISSDLIPINLQASSSTDTLLKPRISSLTFRRDTQFMSKLDTSSLSEVSSVGQVFSRRSYDRRTPEAWTLLFLIKSFSFKAIS